MIVESGSRTRVLVCLPVCYGVAINRIAVVVLVLVFIVSCGQSAFVRCHHVGQVGQVGCVGVGVGGCNREQTGSPSRGMQFN